MYFWRNKKDGSLAISEDIEVELKSYNRKW